MHAKREAPGQCQSLVGWAAILLAWVGVIFFSSTSLAGREADYAFASVVFTYLRRFDGPQFHFLAEKSVHVTMFFVLALLLWRVLPDFRGKSLVILASGTLLGCSSELVQSFFPNRDPTIRDILINLTSTAIGVALCLARQTKSSDGLSLR